MTEWLPATTSDKVYCVNCSNEVDTPEEIASYPNGNCPQCGNSWTGAEKRDTSISVASPTPLGGATF